MQESRRQSMASRRGSTLGGYSWRPSVSGGQQSRRTSVASRRASTIGEVSQGQRLDDVLRLMSPVSAGTGVGSVGDSQGGEPVQPEVDISKIPGLYKALEHIERACVLNSYHDKVNSETALLVIIVTSYVRSSLVCIVHSIPAAYPCSRCWQNN